MCIAIPSRVVTHDGSTATVERFGERLIVSLALLDEPLEIGDYVIVHAGIAIERMEPEEAAETLKLFAELFPSEMGAVEADGATGGAEKS